MTAEPDRSAAENVAATPLARAAAFGVHVLTAAGAALAFLSLLAAVDRNWPLMFMWLGFAVIVDTIDGPIARRTRVAEVLPRWAGDVLDLVVDFLTYVFVPAYAIAASGLLPERLGLCAGIACENIKAVSTAHRMNRRWIRSIMMGYLGTDYAIFTARAKPIQSDLGPAPM